MTTIPIPAPGIPPIDDTVNNSSIGIKFTEVRNPKWLNPEHTRLNCEVNFSHLPEDWVWFTAVPSGDLEHTHEIFERCVAGEFGEVAEYQPPTQEEKATELRFWRDILIKETDWTQGADVPQATKDKWAPYRQALRDITLQVDFPNSVTWPTKP
jgi:hypothetical protein